MHVSWSTLLARILHIRASQNLTQLFIIGEGGNKIARTYLKVLVDGSFLSVSTEVVNREQLAYLLYSLAIARYAFPFLRKDLSQVIDEVIIAMPVRILGFVTIEYNHIIRVVIHAFQ